MACCLSVQCTVKQLYLGKRSEQDTSTYTLFYLIKMIDAMTSQIIDLSSVYKLREFNTNAAEKLMKTCDYCDCGVMYHY
jgi:hypothetical protein